MQSWSRLRLLLTIATATASANFASSSLAAARHSCLLKTAATSVRFFAITSPLQDQDMSEPTTKASASTSTVDSATSSDVYLPGSCSLVLITTPDENSAKKLSHGLIEQKLAACVNIIPHLQSIYMWEGKVNEDNEYLMMVKTRTSRVDELAKWVREHHPYSVAEVIALPIEKGNAPYLKWISQTVMDKK